MSSLQDLKDEKILKALKEFDGHRKDTAESLGLSIRTVFNAVIRMKAKGLDVPSGMKRGFAYIQPCKETLGIPTNEQRLKYLNKLLNGVNH